MAKRKLDDFRRHQSRVDYKLGRSTIAGLTKCQDQTAARLALELLSRLSPEEYGKAYRSPQGEDEADPQRAHVSVSIIHSEATKDTPLVIFEAIDVAAEGLR